MISKAYLIVRNSIGIAMALLRYEILHGIFLDGSSVNGSIEICLLRATLPLSYT